MPIRPAQKSSRAPTRALVAFALTASVAGAAVAGCSSGSSTPESQSHPVAKPNYFDNSQVQNAANSTLCPGINDAHVACLVIGNYLATFQSPGVAEASTGKSANTYVNFPSPPNHGQVNYGPTNTYFTDGTIIGYGQSANGIGAQVYYDVQSGWPGLSGTEIQTYIADSAGAGSNTQQCENSPEFVQCNTPPGSPENNDQATMAFYLNDQPMVVKVQNKTGYDLWLQGDPTSSNSTAATGLAVDPKGSTNFAALAHPTPSPGISTCPKNVNTSGYYLLPNDGGSAASNTSSHIVGGYRSFNSTAQLTLTYYFGKRYDGSCDSNSESSFPITTNVTTGNSTTDSTPTGTNVGNSTVPVTLTVTPPTSFSEPNTNGPYPTQTWNVTLTDGT